MACKDEQKVSDVVVNRVEKTVTSITTGGQCEFDQKTKTDRKALLSGILLEEGEDPPMVCDAWDLAGQFKFVGGKFNYESAQDKVLQVNKWISCTNVEGDAIEFIPCIFSEGSCFVSNGTMNIDNACVNTKYDTNITSNKNLLLGAWTGLGLSVAQFYFQNVTELFGSELWQTQLLVAQRGVNQVDCEMCSNSAVDGGPDTSDIINTCVDDAKKSIREIIIRENTQGHLLSAELEGGWLITVGATVQMSWKLKGGGSGTASETFSFDTEPVEVEAGGFQLPITTWPLIKEVKMGAPCQHDANPAFNGRPFSQAGIEMYCPMGTISTDEGCFQTSRAKTILNYTHDNPANHNEGWFKTGNIVPCEGGASSRPNARHLKAIHCDNVIPAPGSTEVYIREVVFDVKAGFPNFSVDLYKDHMGTQIASFTIEDHIDINGVLDDINGQTLDSMISTFKLLHHQYPYLMMSPRVFRITSGVDLDQQVEDLREAYGTDLFGPIVEKLENYKKQIADEAISVLATNAAKVIEQANDFIANQLQGKEVCMDAYLINPYLESFSYHEPE